jgi:hypothetical protein
MNRMTPERTARIRERTALMRAKKAPAAAAVGPCKHLGAPTGETVACPACGGKKVSLKVFTCAVHGQCVQAKRPEGVASCQGCPDRA